MDRILDRVDLTALESLGLSEDERTVYETLVERGSATVAEVRGSVSGGHRRLPRTLSDLEAKGLLSRASGRPARYAAVPPEVGLELLFVQREEELRRARVAASDLARRFQDARQRKDVSGLIEIVEGQRAVVERLGAVPRMARSELRVMARPPFITVNEVWRARVDDVHSRTDVRVRSLLDPQYFDLKEQGLEFIREDIAAGEEYRVMNKVPLKLVIADDRAALIPLEIAEQGIQSAVLFHASALLDAFIEVFETCWALAFPLDIPAEGEDREVEDPEAIRVDERELLSLLVAGTPDGTIARQLGLSSTTLQRRITALKDRLGATTRLQIGVRAALRGWITDAE